MIPTVEVRWFFRHQPFAPSVFFNPELSSGPRTDWYAFPCDVRTGIKIREGRLEAKLLVNSIGVRDFSHATGIVEHWQKWSASLPSDKLPSETLLQSVGWVGVTKNRYVRRFSVDGPSVEEYLGDGYPASGGQFELTQLNARQQEWWTVGFESYGSENELETNLSLLVNRLFRGELLPAALELGNSFGYPEWLNRLENGK
jgi:hypothetical protein